MKKIGILAIFLFLLSGCDVTYHLSIEDDQIKEEIVYETDDLSLETEDGSLTTKDQLNYQVFQDQDIWYEKEVNREGNLYQISYKHNYSFEEFPTALTFQNFFTYPYFEESENSYYFRMKGIDPEKFEEDVSLNLQITTNHKVLYHNADQVDGNTYIWKLNSNNSEEKEMVFHLSKEVILENQKKGNFIFSFGTFFALMILIGALLWFAKNKILEKRFQDGM